MKGLLINGSSLYLPLIPYLTIPPYCHVLLFCSSPFSTLPLSTHLLTLRKARQLRVNRLMFWQFEIHLWHFNPASVFIAADLRSPGLWEVVMVGWKERWREGKGRGSPWDGAVTQRLWTVCKAQQGLWTCSCIADDKWKRMIMSPPSGRCQNSWSRDKLRQCNRQNSSMCFGGTGDRVTQKCNHAWNNMLLCGQSTME